MINFASLKIFVAAVLTAVIAAAAVSCIRQDGGKAEPPSAKKLVSGVISESGISSPELVFGYGDEEYASRFTSLYHIPLENIVDGAFAISSGMSADEISVIRPAEGKEEEFLTVLEDHVHEEISVFEKYSPEDTANLKNSVIFSENGFVILIVSADSDAIRSSLLSFLRDPNSLPELTEPTNNATEPESNEPETTEPGTSEPETTEPETSAPVTNEPAVTETESVPPDTGSAEPIVQHEKKSYCYENELPESAPQDAGTFFADAVLLGDSRLAGLVLYTAPKVKYDFAIESLSISGVFTKNLADDGKGGKTTIANALGECEFGKIYLMFGVNELGWPYSSTFIGEYRRVVEYIKETNPSANIYVMTMFPTTKKYSDAHNNCNDLISERNALLAAMAAEEGVCLINTADALCTGEDFVLPDDLSGDGVHGNRTANRQIRDFILTHYSTD